MNNYNNILFYLNYVMRPKLLFPSLKNIAGLLKKLLNLAHYIICGYDCNEKCLIDPADQRWIVKLPLILEEPLLGVVRV